MKKNLFMVAAVALMAMVSCNKMEENNGGVEVAPEPSYYVEFTAEAANEPTAAPANAQTRTKYDETNKKTLWVNKDEISVNGKKFNTTELANGGLSARFVNIEELGEFGKPYVAVTPYQSTHKVNGTKVEGVELKSEQTATAASFESNAVIAMAYNAEGNTLAFKNACSIVKFKVGTANVKEVTITSNNGENLAGTVTLDYNNGEPTAKVTANGTSTIKLTGTFNTTSTYYVAVLASGLENGITISLNGTVAKTVANELAFKRNIVMNAGSLSIDSASQTIWTVVGGHNSWNLNSGTPMTKERGLLVAKNVSVTSAGFQFVKNKSWAGQIGNNGTSRNRWIVTQGSTSNITPGQGNYDLYLEENAKAYYIAPAGSPAPTAWSVVGIPNFDTDITMYPLGAYVVAKNVNVSAETCTFKFRTFARWDTNKGNPVNVESQKVIPLYDNGDNCTLKKGNYDIYLKGDDASVFFVVPAGHSLNDNNIIYDLDNKAFVGEINNGDWSTDQNIYVCGDYLGMRNVPIGKFKIRRNKSWDNGNVWGSVNDSGTENKKTGKLKQDNSASDVATGLSGNYDVLIDWGFTEYILQKN